MIKFSYFLQVFLQVILAQNILSSDIFQLRYDDLQSLLVNSRNNRNFQTLEEVLARDGAFVSSPPSDTRHTHSMRNLISTFLLPIHWPVMRNIAQHNIENKLFLFAGHLRDAAWLSPVCDSVAELRPRLPRGWGGGPRVLPPWRLPEMDLGPWHSRKWLKIFVKKLHETRSLYKY